MIGMPFTRSQSAEIDRRLVEVITAIMGEGQYSMICQGIADQRAKDFVTSSLGVSLPALSEPYPIDPVRQRVADNIEQSNRLACLTLAVRDDRVLIDDVLKQAGLYAEFVAGSNVQGDGWVKLESGLRDAN